MICPVCEHQQDFGLECDVCGKVLGGLDGLGPPPVREERVEGLEVTIPEKLGDVPVERMGELEVSRYANVDVPVQAIPDVEQNRAAPVGDVPVQRLGDLTVDRVPDDGQRTAIPTGPLTCRYCRHQQVAGTLCERCGMKLPQVIIVAPVIGGQLLDAEEVKVRCRACGAPATAGKKCTDCGHDVPYPEA